MFSNNIYNYLIDTNILIYENDTLLLKNQKILLKFKRIIAIVLLIILLILGYYCNIYNIFNSYTYTKTNINSDTCILNGGRSSVYKAKIGNSISSGYASAKSGILNAPSNIKQFGKDRAEDAKTLAPWFYGIIYSISITLLAFLIFMPAIGFIIVGLICYSLLKNKMGYIKSL